MVECSSNIIEIHISSYLEIIDMAKQCNQWWKFHQNDFPISVMVKASIDGSVQDSSNSIANAL